MTILQTWILETVKNVVRDMRADRKPNYFADTSMSWPQAQDASVEYEKDWDALEHRLAITLVQARALECRQSAGQIMIARHPTDAGVAAVQTAVAHQFLHRSSELEAIGMEMAQEWPPKDTPKLEIVQ